MTHKFVSSDPSKELPKEVLDLLPENKTGLKNGEEATPTAPGKTEVEVKDGTWTFKKWDKDSKTVDGDDVEFTGTWIFTPNPERGSSQTPDKKKSDGQPPKTGDQTPIELYFALMVLSGSCFALLERKRRKAK